MLRRINAALEQQARSIGQALHDETGQALTAAYTSLAAACDVAPASVRSHLGAVKDRLEDMETQFRRLAYELRPRVLDDLGLVPALKFLINSAARQGVTIAFAATLEGQIPAPIETAVFRLVQEAMTNIGRHSTATRVLLEVEELPGVLRCRIRDNGVGFNPARASASGLGLLGIRDRLNALGATLTIDSVPGQGTALVATIPMEERNVCPNPARRRPPDST